MKILYFLTNFTETKALTGHEVFVKYGVKSKHALYLLD